VLKQSPTGTRWTIPRMGTSAAHRSRGWAKSIAAHVVPRLHAGRFSGAGPAVEGEAARLKALEALSLMDTPPEERFDRIAQLARRVFGTRFAAVTLVDGQRRWMKSAAGMAPAELPREQSYCQFTIGGAGATLIPDTRHDARTRHLAPTRAGVGFYAGYPLRAPSGHVVGALCVFDPAPRERGAVDTALLRDLALLAQRELWTVPLGGIC
jgi:GAF domain-containing protein